MSTNNKDVDSETDSRNWPQGAMPKGCDFHVVGVGASAGGLEAIEKFFIGMPENTGAAFVVVQHLSRDFKSHMAELLSRKTSLAIKRVTNGIEVEPNTIYLIPSNAEMVISNGRLLITERNNSGALHLPIDHFFNSLANECGRKSIGVILSGTGSDGSRGIVSINDAGGLVICQDEETAKFDGMPDSAQQTNAVHLVLPPERMAEVIMSYSKQSLTPANFAEREIGPTTGTGITGIFKLLRREHRIDFSVYKPTTVMRRIERRIAIGKHADIDDYLRVLIESPEELDVLYNDMLINVTRFFRDPQVFELLRSKIIPEILEKKTNSTEPIRIWVAGCASGEEAYSIAIAFQEELKTDPNPPIIKIFATDVHRKSLQHASLGVYPEQAFEHVPEDIQAKYFLKHPDGFEAVPEIRKMIVFAPHDVINDAPFTKLDLVTCRNLLIYLQPIVQKKVLSLFHFALRKDAYMLLGPSETPGDLSDEFEVIDKKWRLYQKKRNIRLTGNISLSLAGSKLPKTISRQGNSERLIPESQMLATYDSLLNRCMKPSFLVDEQGQLIHSFGGAERFLQIRGGRISTSIVDIIHPDLKTSVSGALQHTAKEQKEICYTGISVKTSLGQEHIRLVVDPIRDPRTDIVHTLISIEPIVEVQKVVSKFAEDIDVSELAKSHISTLENELRYTKENLQAAVEELETSNEELQATNEELVASNEEMHSSNEELQSVNEELYTVNNEFQHKITELTELTDDMNNLFHLTEVGVIFLDQDLRIRRFTPKIADLFGFLPQDIGRSVDSFSSILSDEKVLENVRTVIDSESPLSEEVADRRGNHWLLRIIPYRTKVQVDGVVVTLIDLNSVKETDAKLRRYRDIVESSTEAIISADTNGNITNWNSGAEALYGYTSAEIIGQHLEVLLSEDDKSEVDEFIEQIVAGKSVSNHHATRLTKDGKRLFVSITVFGVYDAAGKIVGISSLSHDLTEQRQAELDQRVFRYAFESSLTAMTISDATQPDNPISYTNSGFERLTGYSRDEVVGKNCRFLQGPETDPESVREIREAVSRGKAIRMELLNYRKNGEKFWNELIITPVKNEEGELQNFVGVQLDVTRHQEVEHKLAMARDVAVAANAAKSSFVANMSHEIRTPLTTIVGMTEMLLDHESDKSKHDTLQLIYQSSRHLASLVNDVLDLSKIEAGKLEADFSEVRWLQIIEDVGASMGYRAQEKGLAFKVEYNGLVPETIKTDAVRFRQILFNLAGNAVKFTEQGGVVVRCKVTDQDTVPMLGIEIEDTGIGFEDSEIESLFEQFTQVDDSPTRRRGGSGLGLYISRSFVELLGGQLTARKKEEGGSVFTLSLPVGDLKSQTMIDPTTLVSRSNGKPKETGSQNFDLAGRRILVAEDTRGIQLLLKRILRKAGATVDIVEDGQEVIEELDKTRKANQIPYDIILLDMHMPRKSGYEAAAEIRESGLSTPIIALTASAMKGDREKCLESGCDEYLTKPIDRQKLLEKITGQLSK